jgi:hypothetical protein
MSAKSRSARDLIALAVGLFVVSFLLARYPAVAIERDATPVSGAATITAPAAPAQR